jgi:hypothetical protein
LLPIIEDATQGIRQGVDDDTLLSMEAPALSELGTFSNALFESEMVSARTHERYISAVRSYFVEKKNTIDVTIWSRRADIDASEKVSMPHKRMSLWVTLQL